MNLLVRSTALVVAMAGCSLDLFHDSDPPDSSDPGGPTPPPPGGGQNPPPSRGLQTMSDVHVDQTGEQVWIIHSNIADTRADPIITTAHFGVYVPANNTFTEVLDTTGTLGKKILFPANDRVLLVAQRDTAADVFVAIDTVARRPVNQRTYAGNHSNFVLSPTGRALTATAADTALHLLDTESLVLQTIPGTVAFHDAAWASQTDVLYTLELQATSTLLKRYDLRTADLSKPIAAPAVVATLPGAGLALAISPDDRFAAIFLSSANVYQIAMLDLTASAPTAITVRGAAFPVFTNDNRAAIWQSNPDRTHDLRIVDPATGASTVPLKVDFQLPPSTTPLRRHNALLVQPFVFSEPSSFIFDIPSATRTPLSATPSVSSLFERPDHDELWIWEEYDDTLVRLDLATGAITEILSNVDSVDYRAETDDIVVGTFSPSVRLLSMATGKNLTAGLSLPDPNDVPAPYKLTAD